VDGTLFKSPTIDFVNRGRRFDPILKLASNARVQSLQLTGFDGFFSRVTKFTMPAPKLRHFSIEWNIPSDDKAIKLFNGFLEQCSGLIALELKDHKQYPTLGPYMGTLARINTFESLSVNYYGFSTTTNFLQGRVQDSCITVPMLSSVHYAGLNFIYQASFAQLVIESVPSNNDGGRLSDILRMNNWLTCLRIGERDSSIAGPKVEMNLQDLMKLFTPTASSKLESLCIDYGRFTFAANFSKGTIKDMTMRFEKLADLASDDLRFIQEGPYDQLRMEHAWETNGYQLADLLRRSSALRYRQFKCHGESCVTIATVAEMGVQDLVNLVASETSCIFDSFSVGYHRLTLSAGFSDGKAQGLTMMIDQLHALTSADLAFIRQSGLTQLVIRSTPLLKGEDHLSGILRHCPELSRLQIKFKDKKNQGTAKFDMKLQDLVDMVSLDTLARLESFAIEYRTVSIAANISQGRKEDVAVKIDRFCDLRPDYIRFFQGLTKLGIVHISKADESPLAEILSQCRSLSYLQVGCEWKRSIDVVNLVVSTREKIIEQGGPFSLRTFELMDKDLTPFEVLASRDDNTHIQCHLSFPAEYSNSFDMRTWIRLETNQNERNAVWVSNFIHQYGWSFVSFDGHYGGVNLLAAFSNMSDKSRTANQLESLMIRSSDTLRNGVNILDNIMQQSPNFKDLGLYVETRSKNENQQALSLLHQYSKTLSRLQILGSQEETFSSVISSFQTRDDFPALESFELWPKGSFVTRQSEYTSWIVAMVSGPPPIPLSSSASGSPSQDTVDGEQQGTREASESAKAWTSLRRVIFREVELQPYEWKRVIEALDVSALEYLDLREVDIGLEELEVLVGRIADSSVSKIPFRSLDIRGSNVTKRTDSGTLDAIFARLREKVPSVNVMVKDRRRKPVH
jgi:hypothetical protein